MARPMDVAPARTASLADIGLERGWEPAALLGTTLLLLAFGLVTLYSASAFLARSEGLPDYYYVLRQTSGATIGLVGLALCARVPYHTWRHLAWPMVVGVWILLMILIIPGTESIAPRINGARRWLRVGVTIQPSELAKVAVVVWTAALAVKKGENFRSLRKGLLPFLVVWFALLVPIALEPDFSTAALVGLMGALVVYSAGGRIGHFVFLALLALPAVWRELSVTFRARRLAAFLDPSADPAGAGFQVKQSLIALGSGGLAGVGFGQGRQRFGFLPEAHNDFIFAMIGEEWGLIGVVATVGLYVILILVGFRIASQARDHFGEFLAMGLTGMIALQAFLHMAVGLSLVPPTGLALPLISYGRSNIVVTLIAIGILMAVARETEQMRLSGA